SVLTQTAQLASASSVDAALRLKSLLSRPLRTDPHSPLACPEPRRATDHAFTLSFKGPLSSLASALTKSCVCNFFRIRTSEKMPGVADVLLTCRALSNLRTSYLSPRPENGRALETAPAPFGYAHNMQAARRLRAGVQPRTVSTGVAAWANSL